MTQAGGERRNKRRVNMLDEKGFWEGGVIPNTYNERIMMKEALLASSSS